MSVATLANIDVVVTRPSTAATFAGGETLAEVYKGRGRIQPLSGKETLAYSSDTSTVTAKGYISGTPNILPDDKMAVGTQTYLVKSVRNIDHADSFMTLELEEQR